MNFDVSTALFTQEGRGGVSVSAEVLAQQLCDGEVSYVYKTCVRAYPFVFGGVRPSHVRQHGGLRTDS